VDLYFTPNSDKEVNFNLTCNVRRKTLPVSLNVKAEGYSMDCTLLCEDSLGNRVELSPDGLSQINFGEVREIVYVILYSFNFRVKLFQ
jgi:hydrocephalus-inducing protein